MGRDANFSELRDAIRQGQAKIAQGLKTGQMRSDRDKKPNEPVMRLDIARESLANKPALVAKSAAAEKPAEKPQKPAFQIKMPVAKLPRVPKFGPLPKFRVPLPRLLQLPMTKVIAILRGMAMVIAVALVVLVVFWIGKALLTGGPTQPPTAQTPPVAAPQRPARTRPAVPVEPTVQVPAAPRRETPPAPVKPATPPAVVPASRTGDNAIVIQYIIASRDTELRPVMDFFAKNGVPTEVVRVGNGSYLVTQGRFENPNRIGSDGHAMLQKIRAIGKRYPVETGDRQFGAAPFQDAYGKLMQ
jgi:hypothetical protein